MGRYDSRFSQSPHGAWQPAGVAAPPWPPATAATHQPVAVHAAWCGCMAWLHGMAAWCGCMAWLHGMAAWHGCSPPPKTILKMSYSDAISSMPACSVYHRCLHVQSIIDACMFSRATVEPSSSLSRSRTASSSRDTCLKNRQP